MVFAGYFGKARKRDGSVIYSLPASSHSYAVLVFNYDVVDVVAVCVLGVSAEDVRMQ